VVQVSETGSQLAAARPRTRHNNNGMGGGDVLIGSVTLVADDQVDIRGIPFCRVMQVDPDTPLFKLVLEGFCGRLVPVPCDDHGCHLNAPFPEVIVGLQCIDVVGDAEVSPHLLSLYVSGVDAKDNVDFVFQNLQEPHLDVGIKSGQHPGSILVIQELASELQ
jgi:hypothetical protein